MMILYLRDPKKLYKRTSRMAQTMYAHMNKWIKFKKKVKKKKPRTLFQQSSRIQN
jgi:gas vesicle protein